MKNLSLSLLFVVVLCSCGPEGQRFHGVYDVMGTAHFSIQNFGNYSAPIADALRVSEGTTSDLHLTDPAGRCLLLANLEGEVATLQSGSCTWGHNGATLTLTLTRATVAFSGTSAQLHMSGTATVTAQGKLHLGTFFQSATLHYRGP
jgi:hypothetical protein